MRERLLAMRADLISRLLRGASIEPAHLPQLAGISAAFDALANDGEAEAAARATIDDSGEMIRLMLYRDGGVVAATAFPPTAAVALAGELLSAAGSGWPTSSPS
jgi:hypothetical protein